MKLNPEAKCFHSMRPSHLHHLVHLHNDRLGGVIIPPRHAEETEARRQLSDRFIELPRTAQSSVRCDLPSFLTFMPSFCFLYEYTRLKKNL